MIVGLISSSLVGVDVAEALFKARDNENAFHGARDHPFPTPQACWSLIEKCMGMCMQGKTIP
jgi:hypothetical protein